MPSEGPDPASFADFEMTLYRDESHPIDLHRERVIRRRMGNAARPGRPHASIDE